ncbi:protein translocase subunit SecF [Candidatus Peregrinibacteria bacterium]|nr:protein translocase subunit SecF [Candidatus Peregrinibacteria bacterium]
MKKQFKFIKYTKAWISLSLIVILIGIGAMVYNKVNTGHFIRLGIDFTGGTLMELSFDAAGDDQALNLREAIDSAVPNTVSQITVTDQGTYIIHGKDLSAEEYDAINASIEQALGDFTEVRYTTIGPKIGETLKRKAFVALSIALVAIVFYIAYAFRKVPKRVSPWRFGMCAIIALIHDVLITLGIFALLGFEVDAFFITAILTIIGFSVHDTIVVFDRIRENLKSQGRDDTFGDIADMSLNQTLSRSINTSISTLFTLAALYFLGAESLRIFVFALIIGIFVGTYSSIFIASPALTIWQERKRLR